MIAVNKDTKKARSGFHRAFFVAHRACYFIAAALSSFWLNTKSFALIFIWQPKQLPVTLS